MFLNHDLPLQFAQGYIFKQCFAFTIGPGKYFLNHDVPLQFGQKIFLNHDLPLEFDQKNILCDMRYAI